MAQLLTFPQEFILYFKRPGQALVSVRLTHGLRLNSFEEGDGEWKGLICPYNTAQPSILRAFTSWVRLLCFWALPQTEHFTPRSSSPSFQLTSKASSGQPTVVIPNTQRNNCNVITISEKWNRPVLHLTPNAASPGVSGLLVSLYNNPSGLEVHVYQWLSCSSFTNLSSLSPNLSVWNRFCRVKQVGLNI